MDQMRGKAAVPMTARSGIGRRDALRFAGNVAIVARVSRSCDAVAGSATYIMGLGGAT